MIEFDCFLSFFVFVSDITQAEAYDIFQKCVLEIQKRLIVNLNNFKVAVVDKNGVQRLDDITSKTLMNYVPWDVGDRRSQTNFLLL